MAYLRDAGKLPTGEVGEAQVVEAGGDGGVALDERPPRGVPGELPVDQRVVTQQAAVRAEGDAADVAPAGEGTGCEAEAAAAGSSWRPPCGASSCFISSEQDKEAMTSRSQPAPGERH